MNSCTDTDNLLPGPDYFLRRFFEDCRQHSRQTIVNDVVIRQNLVPWYEADAHLLGHADVNAHPITRLSEDISICQLSAPERQPFRYVGAQFETKFSKWLDKQYNKQHSKQ